MENVRSLDMLEPYGNANPKPIMCICGATLESASEVGGGKHLRMRVCLGASHFECIFFSHTARQLGISEGDAVDLAFTPQINEFRGNVTVQLVTAAVRRHDPTALCSAILAGDESVNWAAAAYCPGRADFVRVWRAMDKDFAVGKNVADVIRQKSSACALWCSGRRGFSGARTAAYIPPAAPVSPARPTLKALTLSARCAHLRRGYLYGKGKDEKRAGRRCPYSGNG